MGNKVTAVIVTYNRREKLEKALAIYLASKIAALVVVDNASTDGTGAYLRTLADPRLHVVSLPENGGGAGGFHEGMKYVHETVRDYDWLVAQDDDAYPDAGTLDKFIASPGPQDADAIIAAVYYPDGGICEMNRPGFLPFKTWRQTLATLRRGNAGFHIDSGHYLEKRRCPVDFASFVGLFIHKRVVEKMGFPDKDWFIYGDDLDYTTGLTGAGFRMVFDPGITFYHDCRSLNAGSVNQKTYSSLWRTYFMYRNGLIIYKRLAGALFFPVLLYKLASWLLAARVHQDKAGYFRLLWLSVVDGLSGDRRKKLKDISGIMG